MQATQIFVPEFAKHLMMCTYGMRAWAILVFWLYSIHEIKTNIQYQFRDQGMWLRMVCENKKGGGYNAI